MTGYPLENVRVVDLTQYVSGPYCTQVLADLGADIVKIERPGKGDVYRGQGPVFANGESASFLTLNRGKRSLELDFGTEDGRARLEELLAQADVLVENMRPGALAKHGLDYESLSELTRTSCTARSRPSARPDRAQKKGATTSRSRPCLGSWPPRAMKANGR